MIGPWYFAGRRWVCTRELKDMRLGGDVPLFGDDRAGSYLALYWTLKGRFRDNTDWSTRQVHWLHRNGRMFAERDHVHTLLYLYNGAEARDADGVPAELALDHPFRGLAALFVERASDDNPPPRPAAGRGLAGGAGAELPGRAHARGRPRHPARHRGRRAPRAAALVRRPRARRSGGPRSSATRPRSTARAPARCAGPRPSSPPCPAPTATPTSSGSYPVTQQPSRWSSTTPADCMRA